MTETKVINWSQGVGFVVFSSCIISTVHSIIETLKNTKGIEVERTATGNVFFQRKKEVAALKFR